MIVRDEEEHLGACLASLDGVVDEVVVVDTGSVDGPVEIARSFGARVDHEAWADDFSRARNAALDYAQGQWILYIDADERLRPIPRTSSSPSSSRPRRWRSACGCAPSWGRRGAAKYRLWRNDPRIRFAG